MTIQPKPTLLACPGIARHEQPKLRADLQALGDCCPITGCTDPARLIAAHIWARELGGPSTVSNALLLEDQAHRLYDRYVWVFLPDGSIWWHRASLPLRPRPFCIPSHILTRLHPDALDARILAFLSHHTACSQAHKKALSQVNTSVMRLRLLTGMLPVWGFVNLSK